MNARAHRQFADIVLGGIREPMGMPGFDDTLDEGNLRLIQGYILQRQRESVGER